MNNTKRNSWIALHFIVATNVLFAVDVEAQAHRRLWTGGVSIDVAHGETLFALATVTQEEIHLVGKFVFEKNVIEGHKPLAAVIQGRHADDGAFWPNVELQVASETKGKWETIAPLSAPSISSTITVDPGSSLFGLRVELDAFQPFIGKRKFGKVVLRTGEEAVFSLEDLAPPPEGGDKEKDCKR